ncbi:hypothetical protein L218DRAFT_1074704 [Marasmius fiardii PR-910]|nr:hypothetical protein L218DRAFT_1074704 [Marasmius fiardii PR-910]
MSASEEVCTFFVQNACNKGDRCFYRHDRASTGKTPVTVKVPCPYFKLGSCKFGDTCLNFHQRDDVKDDPDVSSGSSTRTPCKFFALGNCRRGGYCFYDHGSKELSPSLSTSLSSPSTSHALSDSASKNIHTLEEHSSPPQQPGLMFTQNPSATNLDEGSPDSPMAVLESKPSLPTGVLSSNPVSSFDDQHDEVSRKVESNSSKHSPDMNHLGINLNHSPESPSPLPHLAYLNSLSTSPEMYQAHYQPGLYPAYPGYPFPAYYSLPISPTILSPQSLPISTLRPVISERKKDITVPLCQQHFQKNACLYTSDTCHFRHVLSEDEFQKATSKPSASLETRAPVTNGIQKKCLFYESGNCRNGDACPYLHPGQTAAANTTDNPSFDDKKDLRDDHYNSAVATATSELSNVTRANSGRKLCQYYQQGTCRKGDNCRFSHEKEPSTEINLNGTSLRDQGSADKYGWGSTGDDWSTPSVEAAGDNEAPGEDFGWNNTHTDWTSWTTNADSSKDPDVTRSPKPSPSRGARSRTSKSRSGRGSRSSPLSRRSSRVQTPEQTQRNPQKKFPGLNVDTGASASDPQPNSSHSTVPQMSVWDVGTEAGDTDKPRASASSHADEGVASERISAVDVGSESNEDSTTSHCNGASEQISVWDVGFEGDGDSDQAPAFTQTQLDDAATWDQDWGNENTSQPQNNGDASRKLDLPCKFFGQGHCKWGEDCRFLHIRQEEHEHVQVIEEEPEVEPEIEPIEAASNTQTDQRTLLAEHSLFQCRVKFGAGAIPEEVTTSFESHVVHISNIPLEITPEQMRELDQLVASFGTVCDQNTDITQDAVQARVEYSSVAEATLAARSLNNYQLHSTTLIACLDIPSPTEHNNRPTKDSCCVKLAYPAPSCLAWCFYSTISEAKQESNRLDGKVFNDRKIKASFQSRLAGRRNQIAFAICLENLPLDTEKEDLKRLCNDPVLVEITSPSYTVSPVENIRRLLHDFGDVQLFEHVPSPPSKSKALAFARFHDAKAAVHVVQNLNNKKPDFLGGKSAMTVQLTYYHCFDIPSRQMAIVEREIEHIRDARFDECKVQWDSEGDMTLIRVFSHKAQALARTIEELRIFISGEVMLIPEDTHPFWDEYFDNSSCQKALENMNRDSIIIKLDFRNRHVLLYGSEEARAHAKEKLLKLVKKVAEMRYNLDLTGPGIRALMDGGLEVLEDAGITSNRIMVDVASRKLSLWGNIDEFQKVNQLVGQCESDPSTTESWASCVICRLPPVESTELLCGHVYCNRCITYYIQSRISPPFDKLVCLASVQDDDELPPYQCTTEIPLSLIGDLLSPEEALGLLETSFLAHVQSLPAKFRMCPTLDCRMVYRVTEEDTIIRCPECKLFICSFCNKVSHDGLTCSEYRQIKVSHT